MPQKYQPFSVRRRMQDRIKEKENELDPTINPLAKSAGRHNWEEQQKRLGHDKKKLDAITPPPVEPKERKMLQARVRQLEEAITHGSKSLNIPPIPSVHQMQDNTDGSTDQHLRHENTWKRNNLDNKGKLVVAKDNYGASLELKDLYLRLAASDGDEEFRPGAGSLEQLRSGHQVPLHENHAPVQFPMPNTSQSKYDEIWPDHEPLKSEISAGKYHKECRICGNKSIDKFTAFCEIHRSVVETDFRKQEAVSA